MPRAETPSPQGPTTIGYNPSLWTTVERDFGVPEDVRAMVRAAHARGIAVLLDQVFNHTDSSFNSLGRAGTWRKLADIERVTDGADDGTALHSRDARFSGFVLPSSSGFVYRFGGG